MTSSARRVRTPITVLVSWVLTLLLFASASVDQARAADNYNREVFSCGGGWNAGSYDNSGNLYIPCSTAETAAKNAGAADAGSPSQIRVLNPEGTLIKTITLPENIFVYDVAPNANGSVLYLASGTYDGSNTEVTYAVRKLTVNDAGNGGTLSAFSAKKPRHIATDAQGNVYVADREDTDAVFKYNANGTLVTSFAGLPANSPGDLGGIAVNSTGTRVYTTEMTGYQGSPNFVHRFDSTDNGATYTRNAGAKIGGAYDGSNNACATVSDDPPGTVVTSWRTFFAYAWDIGLDEQGNIYALNTGCYEVLKFNSAGSFLTGMKVGKHDTAFLNDAHPHGMTVAKNGEVYVGESSTKMDLPPDDVTPPTSQVSPTDGATGVPVGDDVTATFNEAVNTATMSFTLKRTSNDASVPGDVGYNAANKTATLNPSNALDAGVQYTATLSGVKDTAGNLAASKSWTFTTASVVEQCTVEGMSGNPMSGTTNADNIPGTAGNDVICALAGNDTITGGGGDDKIDGMAGRDTVSYATALAGVSVNLVSKEAFDSGPADGKDAGIGWDTPINNVENVRGSPYGDIILGNTGANVITGLGGADEIYGREDADTIYARDGVVDKVFCGSGVDRVAADPGDSLNSCEETIADTVAPSVKQVLPASEALGIAPGANVSAYFSEAMNANTLRDASTLRSTTFKLVRKNADGTSTAVAAKVTYTETTTSAGTSVYKAILNPDASLTLGATYIATVTTGAKDLAGNALDQSATQAGNQSKTWRFTVRT